MPVVFVIIGAALLTLLLSPTYRNAALRLLFYRDFPEHPADWAPKFHTYKNGVRVS